MKKGGKGERKEGGREEGRKKETKKGKIDSLIQCSVSYLRSCVSSGLAGASLKS